MGFYVVDQAAESGDDSVIETRSISIELYKQWAKGVFVSVAKN